MNALEAAKVAEAALEDKLGEDIKVLDLRGLSNIADCFVIASGKNANQLHAMANEVEQKLFQQGVKLHHSEGYSGGTVDLTSVLAPVYVPEQQSADAQQ